MNSSKICFLYFLLNVIPAFQLFAKDHSTIDTNSTVSIKQAKEAYNKGDYPESLRGAMAAYRAGQQRHDLPAIADAGNLIGLIDLAQGQAKAALAYFRDAARLNAGMANQPRLAANLINVSLAQSDLNQLDSAIYDIKKSLSISKSFKIDNLLAMGTNHLADFYYREKRISEAEDAFISVLHNKNYQSNWENSFASTGMARIRYLQKRYREAGDFADSAFRYALKADAKWDAVQALEMSHKAYWALGNTKTAYQRLLDYKIYNDSVYNDKKETEINKLFLKEKSIENDNLIKEVRIFNQQRKIDNLIIALVVIISIFLLLTAILIYRRNAKMVQKNQLLQKINDLTKERNQFFEEQNKGLDQLNRHKDRLLSIIGHDLKSPIAVVENTLELFKSGDLDEDELISLIDGLSDQVHAASGMLDSLLVWAGNQLHGSSVKPVPINLPQKVAKVISVLSVSAKRKNVMIDHNMQDLPDVWGDADQVRIMVQNLISNAVKFTSAHGIVKIAYSRESARITMIIADNGVGMSPETLEKIMKGSGDHSSTYGTGNEKGIGLGLRLVKEFAVQNDIELSGQSILGQGSVFKLTFNVR